MVKFAVSATLLLLAASVQAFAPVAPVSKALSATSNTPLRALPETLESIQHVAQSSDILLSMDEKLGQTIKSIFIVLLFGGGLIPAAIAANQAMIGTLSGNRAGGDDRTNYVADSAAAGPALPGQALLFASEEIPLVDIIAIMGRIQSYESIADWKKLPSTEQAANVMWLPRKQFKENIRNAKFNGWPVDPKTGEPVGGAELEKAEKARISKKGALIGDAALDAAFDTWAWGASIATPDKVEATLAQYRNGNTFDVGEFTGAASRGRAVTGLGALTFIVIQVTAYGSLFIAPALRVFAGLDIGFGQLGSCDGVCSSLF